MLNHLLSLALILALATLLANEANTPVCTAHTLQDQQMLSCENADGLPNTNGCLKSTDRPPASDEAGGQGVGKQERSVSDVERIIAQHVDGALQWYRFFRFRVFRRTVERVQKRFNAPKP